jgi:hypothetical protein
LSADDKPQRKPVFHYENGVPVFDPQRIDDLAREQEDARKRDAKYKDDQLTVNKRLMIFTGVLAGCSILAGVVSGWQAHIASQTLIEIQKSKVDTARIVTASETEASAATKNAAAAASFSSSADGINAQTKLAVEKFERIANASEEGIKANREAAGNALNASIDAARTEQRAWVGIEDVKVTETSEGSPIGVTVWVRNTGKTPALNLKNVTIIGRAYPPDELSDTDFRLVDDGVDFARMPGTLMPGAPVSVPVHTVYPMTAQRLDDIKSGREVLYVWGTIRYEDVFKRTHSTKFCVFAVPNVDLGKQGFTLNFWYWKRHNDAD